jgi:hypothetical protein
MSVITIGIRRTRRRRRRGKANHFCVCPHKNAKAAPSVFATDDHCSNNNKSEAKVCPGCVCVLMSLMSSPTVSSFSSLFLQKLLHFCENSSLLLSLIFQHRRIKNEPRKTGDVVARARRARRSVSLFILLLLLGLLRLCLLLSLCLSH